MCFVQDTNDCNRAERSQNEPEPTTSRRRSYVRTSLVGVINQAESNGVSSYVQGAPVRANRGDEAEEEGG